MTATARRAFLRNCWGLNFWDSLTPRKTTTSMTRNRKRRMTYERTEAEFRFFWPVAIVIGLVLFLLIGVGSCGNHSSQSRRSSYTTARFQTTYKYVPTTTTTTTTRRTTSSARPYTYHRTTKAPKDDDPYDAKDYVDADDFYYDHYDDFFDYEDAEDYWYENS